MSYVPPGVYTLEIGSATSTNSASASRFPTFTCELYDTTNAVYNYTSSLI